MAGLETNATPVSRDSLEKTVIPAPGDLQETIVIPVPGDSLETTVTHAPQVGYRQLAAPADSDSARKVTVQNAFRMVSGREQLVTRISQFG